MCRPFAPRGGSDLTGDLSAASLQPLVDLPANKSVVLGLVSSKFPQLEKKEDLIARINEAADFVARGANQTREEALKRLCISPQCVSPPLSFPLAPLLRLKVNSS